MEFTIKTAEAIYTGGGIYVFAGITEDGHHFIASDDPEWVMLTDEPTMSDELTDEEMDDRWQPDWQEDNCLYETKTDKEARKWLLTLYNWLIAKCPDPDIEYMRDVIIEEMGIEPDTESDSIESDNHKIAWYDALTRVLNMGFDLDKNSARDLLAVTNYVLTTPDVDSEDEEKGD